MIGDDVYLGAVAHFLDADLRPAVEDKALRFRLLIASNLMRSVLNERAHDAELRQAELERLGMLLGSTAPWTHAELQVQLLAAVRDGTRDADADQRLRAALLQTLRGRLAVRNPRFDCSEEIETP